MSGDIKQDHNQINRFRTATEVVRCWSLDVAGGISFGCGTGRGSRRRKIAQGMRVVGWEGRRPHYPHPFSSRLNRHLTYNRALNNGISPLEMWKAEKTYRQEEKDGRCHRLRARNCPQIWSWHDCPLYLPPSALCTSFLLLSFTCTTRQIHGSSQSTSLTQAPMDDFCLSI